MVEGGITAAPSPRTREATSSRSSPCAVVQHPTAPNRAWPPLHAGASAGSRWWWNAQQPAASATAASVADEKATTRGALRLPAAWRAHCSAAELEAPMRCRFSPLKNAVQPRARRGRSCPGVRCAPPRRRAAASRRHRSPRRWERIVHSSAMSSLKYVHVDAGDAQRHRRGQLSLP